MIFRKEKIFIMAILFLGISNVLLCQLIKKEVNYSGWQVPNLSFLEKCNPIADSFSFNAQKKEEDYLKSKKLISEHYERKKGLPHYYLMNKRINKNRHTELLESIELFTLELVLYCKLIKSPLKEDQWSIYLIVPSPQDDPELIYKNNMIKMKKKSLGAIEGGIDGSLGDNYFILDYDNDGIYETRICEDEEKGITLNSVIDDFLANRKVNHAECIWKLIELKKTWLNFVKAPSENSLKEVYRLLPEKDNKEWMSIRGKIVELVRKADNLSIEEYDDYRKKNKKSFEKLYEQFKEWQEKSLFCAGKRPKEEDELFKHISTNLHLIAKEFMYDNPYALGLVFKLYPILSEDQSLEIDQMLVDFALMKPEEFLRGLKNNSHLITISQAIDRTFGLGESGFLYQANREIDVLLKKFGDIQADDLKDIKAKCLDYLTDRKKEINDLDYSKHFPIK